MTGVDYLEVELQPRDVGEPSPKVLIRQSSIIAIFQQHVRRGSHLVPDSEGNPREAGALLIVEGVGEVHATAPYSVARAALERR